MYSVKCECGEKCFVHAREAGNTITCVACGSPVQVPKLGTLRQHTWVETAQKPSESQLAANHLGDRILFVALCITFVSLCFFAIFSAVKFYSYTVKITTEQHIQEDLARIDSTPPAEVVLLWTHYLKQGLGDRRRFEYQVLADRKKAWGSRTIWTTATLTPLAAGILYLFWRSKKGKRKAGGSI